ncbi:14449_t:CDS:2, partial [Racocetra fulgida]
RRGFTPKTAQELIQSPAIQEWLQAEQIGYSGGAEIAAYLRDKGCSPIGPSEPVHSLEDKLKNRESKIQELKAELAMEREEMDKFLEKLQTQLANLQMGEQQTKIQASSRK